MASKLQPSVLFLLLAVVLLPAVAAHNITLILSETSNFGTFNSLLNRTSIAAEINHRQTITVLALDDSAAGAISGLPDKTLKQVLSIHVILDYYDTAKLKALKRRSARFTTLFQTTGVADKNMGFLNFTHLTDDRLAFGSAVSGAPLAATFVKTVAAKPYNISVLQISAPIVPPGIEGATAAPFGAPIVVKPLAPAPGPDGAEAPEVVSPADAPEDEALSEDGPANSPEAVSDEVDDESSSAGRVAGASLLVAAGVALLFLSVLKIN